MIDPEVTREIRDAFLQSERDARPGGSCPRPESTWSAARGEAPPSEIRAMLRHVAECGVCSEAWRIARDVSEDSAMPASDRRGATREISPFRPGIRFVGVAAAALAGVAILVLLRNRPHPLASSYRQGAATESVEAVTQDGASLPRNAFVLRWQDLGKDTRYDVAVYTEDLRRVDGARDLDHPEHTVPVEALRDLPAGARLAWRVAARLPDGRRISSGAHLAVLGDASKP